MAQQGPWLNPHPTPLGMFQPFLAQQSESIVLKERILSLSGDSFDIKAVDGRPILTVKGEAFSLSGRKYVMDNAGNVLFCIRRQLLKLLHTYYAEDVNGNVLFEVTGKWSFGTSKAVATFTSPFTGKQESLLMKGDFFDTRADITNEQTGQPVAMIDRQFFNARQLLGGQQTYVVTVAPNVDIALIAAMCVCLDERRNENR